MIPFLIVYGALFFSERVPPLPIARGDLSVSSLLFLG